MYNLNFRKKVFEVKEKEGLSIREVAKRFGIASRSVFNWTKKLEPQLTRKKPAVKINMEDLKKDIEKHPDVYQYERAERLNVCQNCIHHALKRLGVTYKKNPKSSQGMQRKKTILSTRARKTP